MSLEFKDYFFGLIDEKTFMDSIAIEVLQKDDGVFSKIDIVDNGSGVQPIFRYKLREFKLKNSCAKTSRFIIIDDEYNDVMPSNESIVVLKLCSQSHIENLRKHLLDPDDLMKIATEKLNVSIKRLPTEVEVETRGISKSRMIVSSQAEIFESIIQKHESENIFFVVDDVMHKDKLLSLTNSQLRKILENYMFEDYTTADIIKKVFLSQSLQIDKKILKNFPKAIAPYRPHALLFTNTQTGKSTVSDKIGIRHDRLTPASATGFATADAIIEGQLNNVCNLVSIDELQENTKDEGRTHNLASLMSTGESSISSGMSNIITKFYGTLFYLGNTKNTSDQFTEALMLDQFRNTLKMISQRNNQMGSRFGIIVFNNELRAVVSYKKLSSNLLYFDKLRAFYSVLVKNTKQNYTKLYFDEDILKFLESGYSNEYSQTLSNAFKKILNDDLEFADFIDGFMHSHKRVRGWALSYAATFYLNDLMTGKIFEKKKELLELADDVFEEFCISNLDNINNISNVFSSNVMADVCISLFKRTNSMPQSIVYAVLHKINSLKAGSRIIIGDLIGDMMQYLSSTHDSYDGKIQKVNDRIIEYYEKYNMSLSKFSLEIDFIAGEPVIVVKALNRLKTLKIEDIKKYIEEQSIGVLNEQK